MDKLAKLKTMIDEENYPFFTTTYLTTRLEEGTDINLLPRELCFIKAGIPGVKIGDIDIPGPKDHFLTLAKRYRVSATGTARRADEQ